MKPSRRPRKASKPRKTIRRKASKPRKRSRKSPPKRSRKPSRKPSRKISNNAWVKKSMKAIEAIHKKNKGIGLHNYPVADRNKLARLLDERMRRAGL